MTAFILTEEQTKHFETTPFIDINDNHGNYYRLVDCNRFQLPETAEEAKTQAISKIALLESLISQKDPEEPLMLNSTEQDGLVFMLSGIRATLEVPDTGERSFSSFSEAATHNMAVVHG